MSGSASCDISAANAGRAGARAAPAQQLRAREEIALEIAETEIDALVEHLPRLDLLGEQPHGVVAQLAHLGAHLHLAELEHVELDDVGQFHQRLERGMVLEVVQRDAVALRAQAAHAVQQLRGHDDVLQHLDHQVLRVHRRRIDDEVLGEIDERRLAVGDVHDPGAAESAQQHARGGLVAVAHLGRVRGDRAVQQLEGHDVQRGIVDRLPGEQDRLIRHGVFVSGGVLAARAMIAPPACQRQ